MKIYKKDIKEFEEEQKKYGTKVALQNFLWTFLVINLHDLNIKEVSTKYDN